MPEVMVGNALVVETSSRMIAVTAPEPPGLSEGPLPFIARTSYVRVGSIGLSGLAVPSCRRRLLDRPQRRIGPCGGRG
jgi:hypothetical protein